MCGTIVCTADDDGGNGISEYWRKTAGKLCILSAKRTAVHSNTADFEKYPGDLWNTGGTTFILCVYLYRVLIPLQNLFEACTGLTEMKLAGNKDSYRPKGLWLSFLYKILDTLSIDSYTIN